ncbi:Pimeloyl-ACP methyl ester carboxylesterase [Palleronia marisminoris]|uniref:4,5:9,10-diseco-3-hydroxy-5,9, 17-trioxoandrosta-1(10),2-diene-4-oate hydrolase n=1 Tax=Palleronia marisminoris TaxID=315423 RepID=A0A1Y5TK59_9RHOB|nr:alpha/beta fold hydrolase [Palleronia marisminoris]SFH36873.1 Pimeloyl-ACP methyl ester carboxylesterase [Palleronia marisminoris]SLN62323.1 4,5:9,10-diseco-3-hydroxy-5,9, 17-trioxoandrosta-1(10),2-diene-4-oate hydrolase [Palleronia marisminoris]
MRKGTGKQLLLLHGLGGNIASWGDMIDVLAKTNEVIVVDLPGHGASPVTPAARTFRGIADAIADFIHAEDLVGVDCVGHSLGGRVALEMARRGLVGTTIALAPGGFWSTGESRFLKVSLLASGGVARLASPALPMMTRHAAGRAALLAQISARPSQVPSDMALRELLSFAATPTFDALTRDLADGPVQEGTDKTREPVTIVWGRKDRLLLPRQANRAVAAFSKARLHWITDAGHYIPWDAPGETLRLIRQEIGPQEADSGCDVRA